MKTIQIFYIYKHVIQAYVSLEKGGFLTPFEYEPAPLGPHDISLKITHCGICHRDIHLIDGDWQQSHYFPGHEIIRPTESKRGLSEHEIGQRVRIGGLDHLALQFARAYNCEVTAVCSNSKKEEEVIHFRADQFTSLSDLGSSLNAFDFVFCTSSQGIDKRLLPP